MISYDQWRGQSLVPPTRVRKSFVGHEMISIRLLLDDHAALRDGLKIFLASAAKLLSARNGIALGNGVLA